ncbi:hypothetical protein AQUCO_01000012v1 [Aquilegia coerulea]|uniref:BHLH domain-containing protein n=1 Tax=Aquilegia coerulea TaxID=218851 RepID=A0A2G5E7X0_AQUCA|nr:hypothetical protein AQUCO_01000012v1 [Aquilegia coerulea]
MDMSHWLSEMGMEDSSFNHQYQMNSLSDFAPQQLAAAFGEDFRHSFSSESFSSYPTFNPCSNATTITHSSLEASQTCFERPAKQLKTSNSWESCTTEQISVPEASSPNMLSFGNSSSPTSHQKFYGGAIKPKDEVVSPTNKSCSSEPRISHGAYVNQSYAPKACQGNKRVNTPSTKPPSYTQDHIIAERKRREKLSQRFIALSAIVPGLKKMDKASVLGDSIKYLKQLQEKVKILEEQTSKKTMESVVSVRKFQLLSDDDTSSTDENFIKCSDEPFPEIEARVSDKNVLIRIHCEKRKGVLVKTLAVIEQLNLSVLNSNSTPFGTSTLDITVIAEMDEEFNMTVKDLVKNLRSAILRM